MEPLKNLKNEIKILHSNADAVVGHREGAGRLVGHQLDLPVPVAFDQMFVLKGVEPDLVDGVAGVADQFPEKDLLVGVQ